jgi:hypothetical protein
VETQVALFVNDMTLLPVLMPFAAPATVLARFPAAPERILAAHGVDHRFVDAEQTAMADRRPSQPPTANRSVVGTINEFSYLADAHRHRTATLDLLALWLAHTPCGALRTDTRLPGSRPRRRHHREQRASVT